MKLFDVVIIGAGASGLMCAMTAASRGRSVLVIDSNNKVGKKILMSGGGKCNFTNLSVEPTNYISENPHFCISALHRYSQWDFIALVNQYHIPYQERDHGQLFCLNSAKDILNMLLKECSERGVLIKTECNITEVSCEEGRYQIASSQGRFESQSLVVATGALSIPTMGATGFGYEIARQFGLKVLSGRAGLVPLTFTDYMKEITGKLSGLAVEVEVCCGTVCFRENMLFTHRGLSGPVILQISNYWQPGDEIAINLLPDLDLHGWLIMQKQQSKSLLRTSLSQQLPKNLVMELQKLFWPEYAEKPLAEIPDKKLQEISGNISQWRLKPSGTEGYRTAEVTLGGVDTDELSSKTMESKKQPGLYFIGEVVDVTGHLGGYNFQWAWSSGYTAGQFV